MKRVYGFTLIEVMIVIVIVGILLSIALPSYREYVRDSQRSRAASCLMEYAQHMAKFRAAHLRYDQDVSGNPMTLPALPCSQDHELDDLYTFDFATDGLAASSFAIEAVPSDSDAMCGSLNIDHRGVRGVTGTGTVEDCW